LTATAAIAIDAATTHTRTNPAGEQFTVRCYAAAAGAAPGGPATDEHTWFAGHTWRRLFCKQCSTHVGWQFRSRARVFVGLIADAPA